MMMLALENVSTVRIEHNQHWPGNKHSFLTLLQWRSQVTDDARALHVFFFFFFFFFWSGEGAGACWQ